jgi:3-oxoacyl-[acyl-carrier protein] reductase
MSNGSAIRLQHPVYRALRRDLLHRYARQWPSVIILGAASAKMPYAHQVVSNVHKAGLLGLTKSSPRVAPRHPRQLRRAGTHADAAMDQARRRMATERGVSARKSWQNFPDIPIGRFADPDEVAVMVTWLASRSPAT